MTIEASPGHVAPARGAVFSQSLAYVRERASGFALCTLLAIAAHIGAEFANAPAVLPAVLMGMALGALGRMARFAEGVRFTSSFVLRLGVCFMGAKVMLGDLAQLGWATPLIIVAALAASLAAGLAMGRWLGLGRLETSIAAVSVAICGASAAAAAASALARDGKGDCAAAETASIVTVVGCIAMAVYPLLGHLLDFDATALGVFLGGTLHEVAQAVGAGFAVSEETGGVAVAIKLLRVACLAPVILILVAMFRTPTSAGDARRETFIPWFVIGFVAFAAVASFNIAPPALLEPVRNIASWCILAAMVALGMKTSLRSLLAAGRKPLALILLQSALLVALVAGGQILFG